MRALGMRLPATVLGVLTVVLVAVADTGTPFPAGTPVEVATPVGTVTGNLQEQTTPGWVMVQEEGHRSSTAIPEKSIGFVRPAEVVTSRAGGSVMPSPLDRMRFAPRPERMSIVPPTVPPTATAESLSDHYRFGRPEIARPELFAFQPVPGGDLVDGITYLERHAFSVGHYDRHKTPAWVAMRWDEDFWDVSDMRSSHPRNFQVDTELPDYARTGRDYQYATTGYQRGHMARHDDLSGMGTPADPFIATREGCLMSNIVPQKQAGHTVWGKLEDEHRDIVTKPAQQIDEIWVISGPVYTAGAAVEVIGPDQVGAPHAVYKIIGWEKPDGTFTARAYIITQTDTELNLTTYIKTIDAVEEATGLDFFPDMDDIDEDELEAKVFTTLWDE